MINKYNFSLIEKILVRCINFIRRNIIKIYIYSWLNSQKQLCLLLLLLSHFSWVQLCATPWTAAHQAPHPWDSPGKYTGVGCHVFLQCVKVKSESEVNQSCLTLSNPMDCSLPGSSVHGFSRQEYWSGVPLPSPTIVSIFI